MTPRVRTILAHLAGLGVLSFAACHVDQQAEVAMYREVLDAHAAPPPAPASTPDQPLSLADAIALANQHNERLAIAGEDYLQALIDKDRAFAAFMPTFDLAPSVIRREPDGDARVTTTDVPVRGRINVFNGFRDIATQAQAARSAEQRRWLLLDLQQALFLEVAQTYYEVMRSEATTAVLAGSLGVQDERVRDIRSRAAVGMARPLDVAQTQARASATRVSLIASRTDVANGRTALTRLIGDRVGTRPLTDDFAPVPQDDEDACLAEALRARADLHAADEAVLAARRGVDVAFGQYYPSVTLDLDAFLSRQSSPDGSAWTAAVRANLPLFTAGLIHADVRAAWSVFRQACLDRSRLMRDIEQQVRTAAENLRSQSLRLTELKVQFAAAEEALRQAEASYRAGLATNLERLIAQDSLLESQLQMASAQFDLKVLHLAMARACGRPIPSTLAGAASAGPAAAATQPATPAGQE